jgi:enoyl-CoA hydratase/carnithine racemase
MYHLLTAYEFDAAEAYRIGLVQEVVPVGKELDRAIEVAEQTTIRAPLAIQETKASSRRFVEEGFSAAVAALDPTQAMLAASEDAEEGLRSSLSDAPRSLEGGSFRTSCVERPVNTECLSLKDVALPRELLLKNHC